MRFVKLISRDDDSHFNEDGGRDCETGGSLKDVVFCLPIIKTESRE